MSGILAFLPYDTCEVLWNEVTLSLAFVSRLPRILIFLSAQLMMNLIKASGLRDGGNCFPALVNSAGKLIH